MAVRANMVQYRIQYWVPFSYQGNEHKPKDDQGYRQSFVVEDCNPFWLTKMLEKAGLTRLKVYKRKISWEEDK